MPLTRKLAKSKNSECLASAPIIATLSLLVLTIMSWLTPGAVTITVADLLTVWVVCNVTFMLSCMLSALALSYLGIFSNSS